MSESQDIVVKTTDVKRHYGEGATLVRALDGVSVEIERGEFTAIVGPSGSGKTTLLNIIGGLDQADSGSVHLGGEDIEKMRGKQLSDFRRDHIGFIFQAYNLIPVLSAKENAEYVLLLQGVSAEERMKRVFEALKEVGLEGMEDRRPGQLSGGQQQRVAVARAMVSRPDLILADEPTANLDSKTGAALLDMMRDLNERLSMTFVFSTHDEMIMERAKRLIHVKDGKIEKDERR